jgi:hypothetical protein
MYYDVERVANAGSTIDPSARWIGIRVKQNTEVNRRMPFPIMVRILVEADEEYLYV